MAASAPTNPPVPAASKALVFFRRTASTLFLWGLVAGVFVSMQPWAYLGLIALLTLVATREYFAMLRAADVKCFPRFGFLVALAYCGLIGASYGRSGSPPPADLDLFFLFLVSAGAFTWQLRYPIRGVEALMAVAANLLGFVYLAYLFSFATRIVFLVPGESAVPGAFLLLWLLAVTKFTDMGAYIVGSLVGRHKMIPHVSPGKTWEGFAGAILFAQLAGCGLYALLPDQLAILTSWGHVLLLGLLLALLAVVGDLAESVLKRAVNAKDSGRMLPGIGGALDLIDSICFTAPALFFYVKWFLLPQA